jgi:hypothetical protein
MTTLLLARRRGATAGRRDERRDGGRGGRRPGRRDRRAWGEFGLLACVYVFYAVVRDVTAGDRSTALANARRLVAGERRVHLGPERFLNDAVSSHRWLAVAADYDYATLHYVVTAGVLVWLWRAHREAYLRGRRALVTATMLGLIGFVWVPLAPPRMLPGFVDTMARYSEDGWWGSSASAPRGAGALTNQFAAMPSLHVGWALWCGWMIVAHARRRWVRGLGCAYPVTTALVVLGTGNHYLADAAGGVVVLLAGAGFSRVTAWAAASVRLGQPVGTPVRAGGTP